MISRRMVSPRALAFTLVPSVSLALLASLAQAQTAPRYTARELPKVASSVVCGIGVAINEVGDVSQNCLYNAGSYTTTQDVCYEYLGGFCFKSRITKQVNYLLPAVWPASGGSARSISTSVRTYTTGTIVSDGSVVGTSVPIGSRGEALGESQTVRWSPPYTAAGQVVTLPAELQRKGATFLAGLTKNGATWWSNVNAPDQGQSGALTDAVVDAGNRVWFVPSLPPLTNPAESVDSERLWAVQDGLQAVRSRWLTVTQPDGQTRYRHEAWYVRDQQWTRIPVPSEGTGADDIAIASNGLVLFSNEGKKFTWRADQPDKLNAVNVVPSASVVRLVNASGLAAGYVNDYSDSKVRLKAEVWWQGQALNLQSRVTGLPRGLQLRTVEAINDRGQLVVQAEQTSIFASANNPVYKTLLLTPQ